MYYSLFFLYGIHFVISLSPSEDLSITKYTQIGCLTLKSDKEFIMKTIQENSLLPYQTYSSPNMTMELCFRLCRRWLILLDNQQTTCICLYTLNKIYELNEYLGEYSSDNNCTLNSVKIYSLTKDITSLPILTSSPSDDWSLDGCYELQNIQTIRANVQLTDVDFPTALDLCRKHCQITRGSSYYAYFLSQKKSCYCLPIYFHQTARSMALRKPLMHCTFLPSICQGFGSSCKQFYLDTNVDTLIKIDVHRYCLSTDSSSFIFDRILYKCLKSVILRRSMSISTINYEQKCTSITIKTREQWNYLIHSSWITDTNLFIPIDRNSTYIFKDLFKTSNLTMLTNTLCVVIKRTDANAVLGELIQCSLARPLGSVLCAQNPFQSAIPHDVEFQTANTEAEISNDEILSCPPNFTLFNRLCYYADSSLTYDIQAGEQICSNKYSNSTLVKFDSHEWANINVTRFLGRVLNDILLEFFYYILERKLFMPTDGKQQIRLLLGDKNFPRKCVLRYFTSSIGGFSLLHRCHSGGYPICQTQPIRNKILETTPVYQTISPINIPSIEQTTKLISTTTVIATTTQLILSNSTVLFILPNETNITSRCDNCSMNSVLADEDFNNNATKNSSEFYTNTTTGIVHESFMKRHAKYRPLIIILTGPILGLIILFLGLGLLVWRLRQYHGTYSIPNNLVGGLRTKRSSTTVTTGDVPNTPVAIYNRTKSPRFSSAAENDSLLTSPHFSTDDDNIELLPATKTALIDTSPKE
ncbi:hypothetical protein I4U23_018099 [Adineta vaga]|nr:hypothetical protein I4U23_018099 [Adineta vaga]